MTYIVGWKDMLGNAYLCADSVSTSERRADQAEVTTSFGERHVDTPFKQVAERALKIVHLGKIAIAIAGDAELGFSIAEMVSGLTRSGLAARKAFEQAVVSHCPLPTNRVVQLLAVVAEQSTATLLAFNLELRGELTELKRGGYAHVGSIGARQKLMSAEIMNVIFAARTCSPQAALASALAVLQSIGVREYLLEEHGAGGTFCGLYATGEEIRWQPDVLYVVFSGSDRDPPHNVLSMVRDHALIVHSTLSQSRRAFGNSINGALNEQWKATWMEEVSRPWPLHSYDYLVLLNAQWANISVIELLGNKESRHVRLEVRQPDENISHHWLNIIMSESVHRNVVTRMSQDPQSERDEGTPVRFSFFGYEPFNEMTTEDKSP